MPAILAGIFLFACFSSLILYLTDGLPALLLAELLITGLAMLSVPALLLLRGHKVQIADRLRRSEELFTIVMQSVNDGIFDYDMAENKIFFTSAYQNLLGYSEKELGGTHKVFDSLIHPDDFEQAYKVVHDYAARITPQYYNVFRMRHKDGHWVWVLSRGFGIWDGHGKMTRLIGTHTDLTVQKQREEELHNLMQEYSRQKEELAAACKRAEAASEAKSNFLAAMSHEIRTPLNAVVGLARLLKDAMTTLKKQEMMETLSANADLLLQLVNDLLDMNKIESGQIMLDPRPFGLSDVIDAIRSVFMGQMVGKGLEFDISPVTDGRKFMGDAGRIRQIVVNLVGNAFKFTAHGRVSLDARCDLHPDGKTWLTIAVADTGVGIAADKLPHIFDKFVQADQSISRRFGGSGLGLAISRALAQRMGGDIEVSSVPDKGSVFTLSIPVEPCEQTAQTAAFSHGQTLTGGNALIVEDHKPNIMVTTLMLQQLGYSAEVAQSGFEALRKIESRAEPYDVILMDVQMPDLDGIETTRRIRALERNKGFSHFIVGLTAHAFAEDRQRCLAAGMDDYVTKPLNPDILEEKLIERSRAA